MLGSWRIGNEMRTRDPNQPQLLGFRFRLGSDPAAIITDENIAEVFIESGPFTGWIDKPEFYERIGKDGGGNYYLAAKDAPP